MKSINRFFAKIFVLPYLMRDAAIEFQKDNYAQAIKIYLKVLQLYPKYYDAHLWAGTAYSAIEQNALAVECYKKAIEINVKGFDAYYNYSQLELKQNRYENSLVLIIKAIEFTPFKAEDFSNLYYRKGLLEYYLFNYHEALESFNKSLEYMPSNANAENGRSIAAEGILAKFHLSN
jgi:tetratricopeptide (TPR) repeat protein